MTNEELANELERIAERAASSYEFALTASLVGDFGRKSYDNRVAIISALRENARLRGALSYLRTQARNGTLHPQVVIQNVDKVLGKQDA